MSSPVEDAGTRARSHPGFLRALFRALDEMGILYCVLPAKDGVFGRGQSSTTPLAFSPGDKKKLPSVFQALDDSGYWPVQCIRHSADRYLFNFLWLDADVVDCAILELCFGQRAGGRRVLSGEALVKDRQKRGTFWTASPAAEFTWLLAVKAAKGGVSALEAERLRALTQQLHREEADRLAEGLFGPSWGWKAVQACRNDFIQVLLPSLRRRLWISNLTRHPLQVLRCSIQEGLGVAMSFWQPSGVFVVLLGPDGSGKTTVAKFLSQALRPVFARHRLYHWRPGLLGRSKSDEVVTEPHRSPPRGRVASALYLFGFFLDNVLGFCFLIRPFLVRSGLVIFDRYFPDVLVDSRRYRYGGPVWLARLLAQLVRPREKLVLVLDASEANIISRKAELSLGEIRRQRDAYYRLPRSNSADTRFLVTDHGLQPAQKQVLEAAVAYLRGRFCRQHGSWLFGDPMPMDAPKPTPVDRCSPKFSKVVPERK